jgi:hypothetical protein
MVTGLLGLAGTVGGAEHGVQGGAEAGFGSVPGTSLLWTWKSDEDLVLTA